MARDGSGNHSLPYPDFVSGTVIDPAETDANNADISAALTQSLSKDGQTTPSANLPMGGYRHTGVGAGSARSHYLRIEEYQDGDHDWPSVGGTADVITLTYSPATTAYAAGNRIRFKASGANTTNVTVNRDGLGAKALKSASGGALSAADIGSGSIVEATYDGTDFLMTKAPSSGLDIDGLTAETTPAIGDAVPLYDASATANRKMTLANVLKVTTGLTALTAIALDDEFPIYDLSATDAKKITPVDALEVLNLLTEDTSPDAANDFVLSYDASASTVKKVKPENLQTYNPSGSATTPYRVRLPINSAASNVQIVAGQATTGGPGYVDVTFPVTFLSTPRVVPACAFTSPNNNFANHEDASTTTVRLWAYDSGGSVVSGQVIDWIAVGPTA